MVEGAAVPYVSGKAYDLQLDERAFADYGKSSLTSLTYVDHLGPYLIFNETEFVKDVVMERPVFVKESYVVMAKESR